MCRRREKNTSIYPSNGSQWIKRKCNNKPVVSGDGRRRSRERAAVVAVSIESVSPGAFLRSDTRQSSITVDMSSISSSSSTAKALDLKGTLPKEQSLSLSFESWKAHSSTSRNQPEATTTNRSFSYSSVVVHIHLSLPSRVVDERMIVGQRQRTHTHTRRKITV